MSRLHRPRPAEIKWLALFGLVISVAVQLAAGHSLRLVAAVAFVTALGLWAVVIRAAVDGRLSSRVGGAAMGVILVVCMAFPPSTSKDVNSYAMYGRMVATYGASPYSHVPRDFPGDPWHDRVSYFWGSTPSVYGPAFTAASGGVMAIAGQSFTTARLGFQGLAAAALVVATVLVARRRPRAEAIALVGLNPLLLTFGVNDAHCDLVIGAAVVAGALALGSGRAAGAGALLAAAVLVKVSAVPAVAGAAVWALSRLGRRAAAVVVASAGATAAAGLALFGGLAVLEPLQDAAGRHTRFSVWNPVHDALTAMMGNGPPGNAPADAPVALLANLSVAAVGLWLIVRYRNAAQPAIAIAAGLVAYQVLGAYTLSWYAAWSLPALALVWRSPLAFVAMAHASWVAIAYLSGYAAIVVLVAGVVAAVLRRRAGKPALPWIEKVERRAAPL